MKFANTFAILLATVLCGCETAKPIIVRGDNFCKLGTVIRYSIDDSKDTITQVRKSNARYRRVCR